MLFRNTFDFSHIHFIGEQLTAMSATLSSTGHGLEAAYCIDGNTKTNCHTNNDHHYPWLILDFGKTFAINRVDIFNRVGCCGERTKNVEVRVYDELPTPASPNQKFSGGFLLGTFTGPGTNGQHIVISGGKLEKNIRYIHPF